MKIAFAFAAWLGLGLGAVSDVRAQDAPATRTSIAEFAVHRPNAKLHDAAISSQLDPGHSARSLPNGSLLCRIVPMPGIATSQSLTSKSAGVAQIISGGRIINEVSILESGYFLFPKVAPGTYSVVAASPRGTAAFSVWVGIEKNSSVDIAELNISLIPRSDLRYFLALVERQFPGLLKDPAPLAPQRNRGLNRLVSGNGMPKVHEVSTVSREESEAELRELLQGGTTMKSPAPEQHYATAQLNTDGDLIGIAQVLDAAGGAHPVDGEAVFVSHGRIVERLPIKSSGFFRTRKLSPGTYSVFINSPSGFSAGGIEVVDLKTPVSSRPQPARAKTSVKAISMQPPPGTTPPTTPPPGTPQLQVQATRPEDNDALNDVLNPPAESPAAVAPGSSSGSAVGGGDGSLGAFLGAAGLVAGAAGLGAGLSNNDDAATASTAQ